MAQATNYKQSVSGSVGAGMGALFNGRGKSYFILEHKSSSRYHRAGEYQEIIVDQVELGRSSQCAVQFDDSFATVSRKHAAIVREGNGWKLIHLSQTNSTFLNGHPVTKEWYLQNGDEIQLSANGPKLGFIIPGGNKSTVGSIGLSRRLSLFRQQALKPYKTAMSWMAACIVILVVGGIWMSISYSNKLGSLNSMLSDYRRNMYSITSQNRELAHALALQDSINKVMEKRVTTMQRQQRASANISSLMNAVKADVFYIITTVYATDGTELSDPLFSSTGTGFLLDNGTFVTARHCVQSWRYPSSLEEAFTAGYVRENGLQMTSIITAYDANGKAFVFTDKNFTTNTRTDVERYVRDENGRPYKYYSAGADYTDWAYAKVDKNGRSLRKGHIHYDSNLSTRLTAGTEVHVLGYPAGFGYKDGNTSKVAEPIYNSMKVARDGINKNGMIMMSQGVAHGNSGGPLFVIKNGNLYAIGIVSQLMNETQVVDEESGVLLQQQQQYEEHVPIKNIFN